MEVRPLELTLISARDLKKVNLISKMNVYAVVSISSSGHPHYNTISTIKKQKTHVDKHCGSNPTWHLPISFSLPEDSLQGNRLSINFRIVSDRILGDKVVGEVNVPVKELFDQQNRVSSSAGAGDGKKPAGAGSQQNIVTYSVMTPSGKLRGSLSFSFKFGDVVGAPVAGGKDVRGSGEPVMAYPAAGSSVPYQPPPAYGGYPYQYPAGYGGYPVQQQQQYGYYGPGAQQKPKKNNKNMALGIGAGLLGGLLIGDMISDVGDMGAYDAGYDAGFGDGFGF